MSEFTCRYCGNTNSTTICMEGECRKKAATELADLHARLEAQTAAIDVVLPIIRKMIELYDSDPEIIDASDELVGYQDLVAENYIELKSLVEHTQ